MLARDAWLMAQTCSLLVFRQAGVSRPQCDYLPKPLWCKCLDPTRAAITHSAPSVGHGPGSRHSEMAIIHRSRARLG